jgi:tetratricopeptide (TPR) repeat protein
MSIAMRMAVSGHYNEKVLSRILIGILTLAAALSPLASYGEQTTVLINAFDNETGDRSLDWIREGIVSEIGGRLAEQPQLYVFGLDERIAAYERLGIPETVAVSRATAIKIGWDVGADMLVTGRISGTHENFRLDARILNLAEDSAGFDVAVSGKLEDVISLAASLASRLAKELVPGSTLPESDSAARPAVPRSAFEAYIRGILAADPQRRADLFQDAIRIHPKYWAAIYRLGQGYYLDSNYKDSTDLLAKVPPEAPDYPQARFMLGMNAYHQGDYGRAAEIFSALVPGYDVLVNLGAALAGLGDPVGAAGAWRRALEKDPTGAEAAFDLGFLSYSSSDGQLAASRLAQFLQSHPRDAEVMFLLGRTYDQLGRADEARRLTSQAIRLSPRLGRWVDQPIPNVTRVRTQFNATDLRLPSGVWNEARLSRRDAARKASETLTTPRN